MLPNYLGRLHVGGHWRFPGEYAGWLGRPYDPLTTVVDKRDEEDNPYYRECADDDNHDDDEMATTMMLTEPCKAPTAMLKPRTSRK